MRIIRGSHRGRQINPPRNLPVRPTTDLAKESLFNILDNNYYFEDLKVLDLFAGTGSISFEFASRGCMMVLSVDSNVRCIKFISETSEKIGLESIRAIRSNAFVFLRHTNLKFDIIFADPPYDLEGVETIPQLVFERKLLLDNGRLILEHPRERTFKDDPRFIEQRKYGKVNFSFFK